MGTWFFLIVFQLSERYTLLRSQKNHVHIMGSRYRGSKISTERDSCLLRGTDFSVIICTQVFFILLRVFGTINKNQERKPCANLI